ncbi:hypothetical protein TPA4_54 [Tsukamurella phage TPA4]|uniref:phosphofructokinase n=1 Tax=Tsukamurella phage TPA4 TaxID=1647476 RepID=UPI0007B639B0|nr:phosphofructokinase [Tsukamurella phage TPA4]AKJ72219.1 hypothetical protein TPA4_54 [Tsukamurella phage TPA4]
MTTPTNPVPVRSRVLDRARSIINGDRRAEYGPAKESFERIAQLWTTTLGYEITAAQVALCLAQLKISRLIQTPDHADSWVDLAGYAALGAEVAGAGGIDPTFTVTTTPPGPAGTFTVTGVRS